MRSEGSTLQISGSVGDSCPAILISTWILISGENFCQVRHPTAGAGTSAESESGDWVSGHCFWNSGEGGQSGGVGADGVLFVHFGAAAVGR